MQEHAIRKMSVCLVLGIGFIRMVTTARSYESIGAENTATAFPVPSATVLRIPLYQRTLSCNNYSGFLMCIRNEMNNANRG